MQEKEMSQVDRDIIQKIKDIRECELAITETRQAILQKEKEIINLRTKQEFLQDEKFHLQARQKFWEETVRTEQDELFKLYDKKV